MSNSFAPRRLDKYSLNSENDESILSQIIEDKILLSPERTDRRESPSNNHHGSIENKMYNQVQGVLNGYSVNNYTSRSNGSALKP
jgi:hypothetical protein